jgi:hypothetical protein
MENKKENKNEKEKRIPSKLQRNFHNQKKRKK